MKFIESATVPVIKLIINLQKISNNIQRGERQRENLGEDEQPKIVIEKEMKYLGIDITFENQSFSHSNLND